MGRGALGRSSDEALVRGMTTDPGATLRTSLLPSNRPLISVCLSSLKELSKPLSWTSWKTVTA